MESPTCPASCRARNLARCGSTTYFGSSVERFPAAMMPQRAVSYTPRDVYKRQGCASGVLPSAWLSGGALVVAGLVLARAPWPSASYAGATLLPVVGCFAVACLAWPDRDE
ncbi:hypothetical protein [Corynebacterium sp. NML 120412]|uniref:hypothetical protein n=1 Tax=Corynebacterium sp. NML 120412 TaxID=2029401 RepID=UPI0011783F95|nr:hypothetical protein [Corynebacterium sp. NML 120412]